MSINGKKTISANVSRTSLKMNKTSFVKSDIIQAELRKTSKKKKLGIFLLSLFVISLIINSSIRLYYIKSTSGDAVWRETNGQKYLDVNADTSYGLGYLTGQKLGFKILGLKTLLTLMAGSYDTNYNQLIIDAKSYLDYIPSEHLEEMNGLANGASNSLGISISFEDILLQNTFIDILYGEKIPGSPELLGCTIIAANNSDNNIEFGQNFDFPTIFKICTSFVLHKLKGRQAIFGIKFGASLNYPMAKNENNVSVLTSVVSINITSDTIIPITSRTRIALENATNVEEFKELFYDYHNSNPVGGLTITIIDADTLISIDSIPAEKIITYPDSVVKSNTFVEENWQKYLLKLEYSKDRQEKAEILLVENYIDSVLTNDELTVILKDLLLCQKKVGDPSISTLAFFTSNSFGLGYTDSAPMGVLPI